MNLHILQHVSYEGPGYIAQWLADNGHAVGYTRFYEKDHQLPTAESVDALLIMGGPMGVYDEHLYPWLLPEKALIEDCIRAGKKVLGICLGAQLIATCLGAFVCRAPNKEIGWFSVSATKECGNIPWLHRVFGKEQVVFHWHGDKFDIPYGAYDLLTSEANANQAFLYGDHVLGLQFHAEVTEAGLTEMLEYGRDELQSGTFVQTEETIRKGNVHASSAHALMNAILDHFFVG